ncbi:MAG: choline-sulfatase [Puniceicoccaceae bacterium]|nr:MAG: choline-sulfatase [Puniceicoccaceae bacterium]
MKPNLLLIVTDQQRFDTLAAAGHGHMLTPHLDWLTETGTLFERCYSDAPVCAPARSTLITGVHYHNQPPGIGHFGQPSAPDPTVTLPALLTRAGYQTKAVGKLHYHPVRCTYGWEHAEIMEDYYHWIREVAPGDEPMAHGLGQNEMHPGFATVPEHLTLTHWTVRCSVRFLESRDPTRPFFLYTGFSKPHPPFDPIKAYWDLYDGIELPEPVRGDWVEPGSPLWQAFSGPTHNLNGIDNWPADRIRAARRAYYALISQIDYNLGHLFARLRELGELDHTWIVFTSDHGENLGDHGMGAKTNYLEGSAHVPLIIRPPAGEEWDHARGSRAAALSCLADLFPTLMEAAGETPPAGLDGRSLLPALGGEDVRGHLRGGLPPFHCWIEGRWKYHFSEEGGGELLFDLETDPHECVNLAAAKRPPAVLKRLRAALVEALESSGSPAVRDGRLVATRPAASRRERRAKPWPGYHSITGTPEDLLH